MKKIIKIEIEIDDEYIKKWNKDFLNYHTNLYKNEENTGLIVFILSDDGNYNFFPEM